MFQITNAIATTEWGPARHNPESPMSWESMQAAVDLRDAGEQRPDDN